MSEVARASACSIGFSRCPGRRRLKPALQTKVRATKTILLLFAMLASAAPLDLSAWKYRKRIPLTPGKGLVVVKLDREVYAANGTRHYVLRVVRDGEEVPYVLESRGPKGPGLNPDQMFDEAIVPGVGLQFTLHHEGRAKHNGVVFQTALDCQNRVRVETSQDAVHWAIARDNGRILQFSLDGPQKGRVLSSLYVSYPVSSRPFVRITVFGWAATGNMWAKLVPYEPTRPEDFEEIASVTPKVIEDQETKSTLAFIDLGVSGLNVGWLTLETSAPQFQRAVEIESSDDGKAWQTQGFGSISRLPGPDFNEESLRILTNSESRYFRIRIYNRDDKSISVDKVRVEGLFREVKFLAPSAGTYWLYYGNPVIRAPAMYDLVEVINRQRLSEHNWTLGSQESNPVYRPPPPPKKPWSEQHPAILYTVLGGAVLALGIATFRFATRLRPNSSQ
jgi:hypothetical protein